MLLIASLSPFLKWLNKSRSRQILDSDDQEGDTGSDESTVEMEMTVSKDSPAPMADSNDDESDSKKPAIVADVQLFCSCLITRCWHNHKPHKPGQHVIETTKNLRLCGKNNTRIHLLTKQIVKGWYCQFCL